MRNLRVQTANEGTVAMAQKITSATTYGGSGVAMYFGLTANEIAAFGGLFVAVIGLVANIWITWHFKSKHYKLK